MMDAADFDYRKPKAMRHTATTLHLTAGKPIGWVAKQAGRSIAETERTYFHSDR
jgi:integrase